MMSLGDSVRGTMLLLLSLGGKGLADAGWRLTGWYDLYGSGTVSDPGTYT